MKSILYVGATLMIGASIYGFVDYRNTSHKKEFTNMYDEEKKASPVVVEEKTVEPAVTKKVVVADKKAITKKQVISKKEAAEEGIFSIEPIADDERIVTKETKEIGKTVVEVQPSGDNTVVKKVKKKKRVDPRIFSRAPLKDVEDLPKPVKKLEDKEQ